MPGSTGPRVSTLSRRRGEERVALRLKIPNRQSPTFELQRPIMRLRAAQGPIKLVEVLPIDVAVRRVGIESRTARLDLNRTGAGETPLKAR